MTNKKKSMYVKIFKIVKEILPCPSTFTSDFEKGFRMAAESVWPGIALIGCYFHHCQAIRRKMMKFHGTVQIRNKETSSRSRLLLAMFFRLPLLPLNFVEEGYNDLLDQIDQLDIEESR